LKAIINQYIATTSIRATNNTINAIILPFVSGDLLIASIAHFISNHSPTQAHNHANQIANHAHIAAATAHEKESIWNATINAYIAADSINATHSIEIVKKNEIILGFFHITSSDFSDIYHLPIATHTHANQIANHAHIAILGSTSAHNSTTLNAIIKPYIAVTSTKATNNTINVIILPFISGFLSIAFNAQAINCHSPTHAHNPANQIANHAQIAANPVPSKASIWNATINAYIAADSISATQSIETVKKNEIICGLFHITSRAFSDIYHLPIATHNQANQIANHAHIAYIGSRPSVQIILNAIIKPYIAVTSTKATNNTINVIILPLIDGFLSIAPNAQAINCHSHIQAPNQANQIANHAQIELYKGNHSAHSNWKATTNQYITADSTNAIPNIVTVK